MSSLADPVRAALPPGAHAPDFALADASGRMIRLSDLRGQPVILAFYPSDWDPSRADQLAHFNWLVRQVPGMNAELLGISMDGMWCQLAFADDEMRVPLLADLDPHGAVAAQYGVRGGQALFVIDAEGAIAWRHVGRVGSAPLSSDLVAALRALQPPGASDPAPNRAAGAAAPCVRRGEAEHAAPLEPSRREFVATVLAAALALAAAPLVARAETLTALAPPAHPEQVPVRVTLTVNGRPLALSIEPRVTLLDALREYAGLTGSKKGCDHGQCGACTVHVNGRRQLSCLTFAVMHEADEITTVEGLASGDTLHPMQTAFITHDGFQCGYCTSGQLMSATALLKEPCGPSDAEVRECMSGNICRCGAYPGIVAAIQDVRAPTRGG
jgi:xanthine dehydrogenase YagT iron-sulfur-binding subunit